MFEVWENDGRYIQGRKIHKKTLQLKTAKALATKVDGFHMLEDGEKGSDVAFWISDKDGMPIGLIRRIKKEKK